MPTRCTYNGVGEMGLHWMTGLKRKPRFLKCLGNERNPETAILALHGERTRDSDFCAELAARRVWGRLGRFRGVGGVCDELRGWLAQQEINIEGVLSAGNAHEAPFFRPLNNQPPSTLRHLPLAPRRS